MLYTIDRDLVTDALVHADLDPDEVLREDYSGRAMYGDSCFGIVGDLPNAIRFCTALGIVSAADGETAATEHALDLASAARVDDMGTSKITYFPGWQLADSTPPSRARESFADFVANTQPRTD